MDSRVYGRITYDSALNGYTLEVFDKDVLDVTTNGPSYQEVEEYFYKKYPTGYIIPHWLGV